MQGSGITIHTLSAMLKLSLLHQRTADPLKPLVSSPHWIWTVATAIRGMSAHHERHIRPYGNFMTSSVPVCLPSSCLSSIMIVLINEWWIIAYQSSIISPWLPHRNWGAFVLVERCICVCGSWCGRLCPALWWKDRHIQSKEPWSSFTSHAITHFLYICRL